MSFFRKIFLLLLTATNVFFWACGSGDGNGPNLAAATTNSVKPSFKVTRTRYTKTTAVSDLDQICEDNFGSSYENGDSYSMAATFTTTFRYWGTGSNTMLLMTQDGCCQPHYTSGSPTISCNSCSGISTPSDFRVYCTLK